MTLNVPNCRLTRSQIPTGVTESYVTPSPRPETTLVSRKVSRKHSAVIAELSAIRERAADDAAAAGGKKREADHRNGVARCPFPIFETHASFPPLSDSVDVVFNERQGRHVVARKVMEL